MAEATRPLVALVMGSKSDWELMRHADETLARFDVPHECRVLSAHRTPDELRAFIAEAEARGVEVWIAAAGGAAHLAGVVTAHTVKPVLGVPIASTSLNGLDSLLAIVQMPAGIPVGTLAIGKPGATNAAIFGRERPGHRPAALDGETTRLSHRTGEKGVGRNRAVRLSVSAPRIVIRLVAIELPDEHLPLERIAHRLGQHRAALPGRGGRHDSQLAGGHGPQVHRAGAFHVDHVEQCLLDRGSAGQQAVIHQDQSPFIAKHSTMSSDCRSSSTMPV